MSKTLEAILAKSDDDDESPLTAAEGALPFASAGEPAPAGAAAHEQAEAGPSISVDAMFDVDVDIEHAPDAGPKWSLPPPLVDRPVGDLLDEVAEALNVQATESRERAIGRGPEAEAPRSPPAVANTPLVAKSTDFEFEDPEDGPTTLNTSDEANSLVAATAAGRDTDEDEEAVVLGPAMRRGDSQPNSGFPGAAIRANLPAPPMPGSRPPANSRPWGGGTPSAGLPAPTLPTFSSPTFGRARLPTPAPGHVVDVPSPASGRSALASSSPLAASDAAPFAGSPDSSRRISRVSGSAAVLGAGGPSDAGHHHGLGLVGEPLSAALSSASTILKKDVRFRVASLAALVLVTFAGGILIGRAVMRGKDADAQPAVARAADPAPAAPVADPAKHAAAGAPAVAAPAAAPPVEAPKIEPVAAPPTVAEAAPPGVGPMQFDPQPIHRRRARRPLAAPNDDPALAPPSKGPVRVASAAAPPPAAGKTPTAGKSAPKKKSAWHDPFAD